MIIESFAYVWYGRALKVTKKNYKDERFRYTHTAGQRRSSNWNQILGGLCCILFCGVSWYFGFVIFHLLDFYWSFMYRFFLLTLSTYHIIVTCSVVPMKVSFIWDFQAYKRKNEQYNVSLVTSVPSLRYSLALCKKDLSSESPRMLGLVVFKSGGPTPSLVMQMRAQTIPNLGWCGWVLSTKTSRLCLTSRPCCGAIQLYHKASNCLVSRDVTN